MAIMATTVAAAIPSRRLAFHYYLSRAQSSIIIPTFAQQQQQQRQRQQQHQRCITNTASSSRSRPTLLCNRHRRPISIASPSSINTNYPYPTSSKAVASVSTTNHSRQLSNTNVTMSSLSKPQPQVHGLFHKGTSTMTYIIADPATKQTIILDSVLDYDASSGTTSDAHGEAVVEYCTENGLEVCYILESHVHADHLTGAKYLKDKYPTAKTGIGAKVTTVQKEFSKVFNYTEQTHLQTDGSQFDILFSDGDTFQLGDMSVRVMNTPGHTPACVCYVVGDSVFTGDTIFMPDFGTARCDFPGGSSSELYSSVKRLYDELDDDVRVFVGHDYQPGGRELLFETTIGEEKESNKQLTSETSGEEFAAWRSERDGQLGVPKLILPALQVNLRGGEMPEAEENGVSYLKIPINYLLGGKK